MADRHPCLAALLAAMLLAGLPGLSGGGPAGDGARASQPVVWPVVCLGAVAAIARSVRTVTTESVEPVWGAALPAWPERRA